MGSHETLVCNFRRSCFPPLPFCSGCYTHLKCFPKCPEPVRPDPDACSHWVTRQPSPSSKPGYWWNSQLLVCVSVSFPNLHSELFREGLTCHPAPHTHKLSAHLRSLCPGQFQNPHKDRIGPMEGGCVGVSLGSLCTLLRYLSEVPSESSPRLPQHPAPQHQRQRFWTFL